MSTQLPSPQMQSDFKKQYAIRWMVRIALVIIMLIVVRACGTDQHNEAAPTSNPIPVQTK